jgi:CheY-like chemotaxis protein
MSHEIRTPLNSVVGMSHIMLTNNPREDQKQHLEVLLFSANNLLGIVNDILDFSKIEAGKISFESVETDIYSIINNIFLGSHSEALNKGIELKVDFDKQLSTKVMCDPTRLAQVINNLVFNAIKFTQKGSVLIHIKIIHQTDEEVTVYFAVKDTGIGIEADKQKLIFEQFTQADSSTSRSFGGTGLGLSICKRILELQDTELKIESEIGKGSIFYFVQQFKKAGIAFENHNTALNSLPNEEDMPFTGLDILLVEDNAMNIMVAKTFLERWGATVDIANNGQQALQLFHTSAKYKLILMDMHMPVMDGYTATKILRDEGVTLPIIALTASLPKEIEEHITELGINDIVVKPFVPNELYRKVYFSIFPK